MTRWTAAYQAPLSMEFSKQEYWSGLPCPSPGDLPNPGIKPRSSALQVDSLPSEPPGKVADYLSIYLPTHTHTHTHTCTCAHTHILLVLLSLSISFSRGFSLCLDSLNQQQGISNSRCVRLTEGVFLIIPKMQWVPFSQSGFSKSGMGLKMCIFTVSSIDSHACGKRVTFEKHCSAYSFWRISSILLSLMLSMRWLPLDLFLLARTPLISGFYNCFTFNYLFLKQLISLFPL